MHDIKDIHFSGMDVSNDESNWTSERVFVINCSDKEMDRISDEATQCGAASYEIVEFTTKDEYRAFAQGILDVKETNLIILSEALFEQYGLCAWDGIEKLAALRNLYLDNPSTYCMVEQLENSYGKEIGYCTELFDRHGNRIIVTHEELVAEAERCSNALENGEKGIVVINKYYPSMQARRN